MEEEVSMAMHRTAWLAILAFAAFTFAGSADAQVRYQCRTATGSIYISDRPCGSTGSVSPPVYYGPTEQTPTYTRPLPGIGEAPEYITYMSPRCSALNDALRTASARGLDSRTQSEMHRNYQRECAEDESDARSRWAGERGEKKQMARSEAESAKRAQERTKLQQEQCAESKRILLTKRQRTDLTEGERAELQRFEANYKTRCS
jgi:hypothetical protein